MSSEVKVLVLDLDGTLARTAEISQGRRTPHNLLKFSKPSFNRFPLAFNEPLNLYLCNIIRYGVPVVIITRSPRAYASTLLQLLGVDYSYCIPSSLTSAGQKIKEIAQIHEVAPGEILYLGDTGEDQEEASLAGAQFEYPYWIIHDLNARTTRKSASKFFELALKAEAYVFEDTEPQEEINRAMLLVALRENEIKLNLETFSIDYLFDGSPFEIQLFNSPFISEKEIFPPIRHELFTRFEYENSYELRDILFLILNQLLRLPRIRPTRDNAAQSFYENYIINSFSIYMNRTVGETYWHACKDFKGKSVGSGPEVQLHLTELISLMMSACLENDQVLIPVPSSSYTSDKPGEISSRIAHRIGKLKDLSVLDALTKSIDGEILLKQDHFSPEAKYVLIDDQLTSGTTIYKCLNALPMMIKPKIRVLTWSYSPGRGWFSQLG